MSNVPFYVDSLRWGNKYGNTSMIDGLAKDGLTDVYDGKAMGNAAELCAKRSAGLQEKNRMHLPLKVIREVRLPLKKDGLMMN